MKIDEIKEQICVIGTRLWQLGYIASNDGNISVKVEEGRYLITPTGVSKGFMKPEMILEINNEGKVLSDNIGYKPTSEVPMHLRCYHDRPDVCAVVHAHPPIATAFAVAHKALDAKIMPELVVTLGYIPLADYGGPYSNDTQEAVARLLPTCNAMLLKNHGVVTLGENLLAAYNRMETVEHVAKITLIAGMLGGAKELTEEQVAECVRVHDQLQISGKYPLKI